MREKTVGIRELKTGLSRYVQEVKTMGLSIVVTEHGQPVARIIPETESFDDRLLTLRDAGVILWNGKHLNPELSPKIRLKPGGPTASDIVVEQR